MRMRHGSVVKQRGQLIFVPRYKNVFLLLTRLYCVILLQTKNKERENVNNEKDDDNYIFVMHNGVHSKSVYESIMNSGATN